MKSHQLLEAVNMLWSSQAKLKELEHSYSAKIQKITQDEHRNEEQKNRSLAVLAENKATLQAMIARSKQDLLAETRSRMQGLIEKLVSDSQALPSVADAEDKAFNGEVYAAILPLTELAYEYEYNGSAEEHAKRLASIFDKKEDAISYLYAYAQMNPKGMPLHDACLFTPPDPSPYQHHWLHLARKDHGKNLLNQKFVKLLNLAKDLETQLEDDKKNQAELEKSVQHTEEELTQKIKLLRDFCDKYAAGQYIRDPENKQKNKDYLKQLSVLYSKRSILHLQKPFDLYSISDMDDIYHRLIVKNPVKGFFIEHGIDDKSYQKFMALDRSKAGKNIPDILLDCGKGFYIKKLNVQNTREAAIAACLGKLTDCCQSVSGEAGEECAIHGLTSKDSGFYVLFKGNAKHPDMDKDIVYAQTWVNRTTKGGLLFDSIESAQAQKNKNIEAIVVSAYRRLAAKLVSKYHVPNVQCGVASGISFQVGLVFPVNTQEAPKGYDGYRDSELQMYLADARSFFDDTQHGMVLNVKRWQKTLKQCEKKEFITNTMRFNIDLILHSSIAEKFVHLEKGIGIKAPDEMRELLVLYKKQNILKKYIDEQTDYYTSRYIYTSGQLSEDTFLKRDLSHEEQNDNAILENLFAAAVQQGHMQMIQKMSAYKASSEVLKKMGTRFLATAANNGHKDVLDCLIRAKVSINSREYLHTPLGQLIHEHYTPLSSLKMLIDAKASIDDCCDEQLSPLSMVIHDVGKVKLLLSAKADVNLQDVNGTTALWQLVMCGFNRRDVLHVLLEAKADVNLKDKRGTTALDKAKDQLGVYSEQFKRYKSSFSKERMDFLSTCIASMEKAQQPTCSMSRVFGTLSSFFATKRVVEVGEELEKVPVRSLNPA